MAPSWDHFPPVYSSGTKEILICMLYSYVHLVFSSCILVLHSCMHLAFLCNVDIMFYTTGLMSGILCGGWLEDAAVSLIHCMAPSWDHFPPVYSSGTKEILICMLCSYMHLAFLYYVVYVINNTMSCMYDRSKEYIIRFVLSCIAFLCILHSYTMSSCVQFLVVITYAM